MMLRLLYRCLFVLIVGTQTAEAWAQGESPAQLSDHRIRAWSLQPRPMTEARYYIVTEVAVLVNGESIGLADQAFGPDLALDWDVGAMRNVTPHLAVGGTLGFTQGNSQNTFSVALKPRVRYWGGPITFDLSPGITVLNNASEFGPEARLLVDASAMYRDWVGITTRILRTHAETPLTAPPQPVQTVSTDKTDFYLGLRLGSYPGIVAGALGAVATVIITSAFWND